MQHSIEIPEYNKTFYMPSDLSECDSRQYIEMCHLILNYQLDKLSYEELRLTAVYKLLNLKLSSSPDRVTEENKLTNIYLISELLDSFFEVNEAGQKVIKQYYVHNPIPKIAPLWATYYGPSDSFMNLTFGEYVDVLRLFLDFSASKDFMLLYDITAILYRPKKPFHFIRKLGNSYNGDCRVKYNSNKVQERAVTLRTAPVGFIFGVYLLFASFQKYITTAKIPWGGNEIDLSILFSPLPDDNSTQDTAPSLGMDSLVFSIAESGVFGDFKEVRASNFWEIIIRIYDLTKRDQDERQKNKSNG